MTHAAAGRAGPAAGAGRAGPAAAAAIPRSHCVVLVRLPWFPRRPGPEGGLPPSSSKRRVTEHCMNAGEKARAAAPSSRAMPPYNRSWRCRSNPTWTPGCPNCTSATALTSCSPMTPRPACASTAACRPWRGPNRLTGAEIERIARTQMGDGHVDELHVGREVDFSFSWRDLARVRGNAFYQRSQCSLSLRRIPTRIPSPTELGIPGVMAGILHNPSGLILVTGPTGSGKSTTHGFDDRRHQPQPSVPHRHHRGPDRARAHQQTGRHQPAPGRHRHRILRDSSARRRP